MPEDGTEGAARRPVSNSANMSSSIAGGGSGIVATILCSPLDVAKTRQQVQAAVGINSTVGQAYDRGVFSALRTLWVTEGFAGCFRGLGPALLTAPTFWAVYWPSYNKAKSTLAENPVTSSMPTWLLHMASAVGAGAVADTITNPLWVIRTRMQAAVLRQEPSCGSSAAPGASSSAAAGAATKQGCAEAASAAAAAGRAGTATAAPVRHHSMVTVAADMLKHEGPRAFYKGLTATFLGLSHVAVQFPLYEKLKAVARDRRGGEPEQAVDLVLASATSKMCASVATYPHEVIRARMQFTFGKKDGPLPGLRETVRAIIAVRGVGGLYVGLKMNMVRVVPNCVSAFLAYEYILRWIKPKLDHGEDDDGGTADTVYS